MIKKDLTRIFIDEIYSNPPKKNYPINKIIYNHIDEIWSIDLADMIQYKTSNNKRYRYIFIIIDNFSKYLWAKRLKNNCSKRTTHEFSNILSTSQRSPVKIEARNFIILFLRTFCKLKIYDIIQDSQIKDLV